MPIGTFKCWCASLLGVGVAMCSSAALAELRVENAWVKLAPPGARANAAYVQLHNNGDAPVIIQSLSANCCAELMLHRTRYENDQAIMEHLEQLIIPAQGDVKLVPGGIHIMLLQASKPLQLGERIELQLHFANGQQQTIHLPVKANDD
jgi:periplasmic copper chaperone A